MSTATRDGNVWLVPSPVSLPSKRCRNAVADSWSPVSGHVTPMSPRHRAEFTDEQIVTRARTALMDEFAAMSDEQIMRFLNMGVAR